MIPLPVPVCASVFVMAQWAQYIRDAQGWKLCQQHRECPSWPADRPAIGPAEWNQGSLCTPTQPHPTPPHPGVSHSHKVISLVVSFVQPVIVWCPHDSAQTVPRDPHLQWAGRVRERRTVKDGFYRAGGMWITEEMLLNISICLSLFYFIFLLYGVKKSNQIKADGNAAGCKERQQL